MSKSKKCLSVLIAIILFVNTIVIGASAVLNDGNMLSADINLEIGTVSGSVFTPLETGTALHTGDVITVRICPTSDFYCGVSRYVVMFSSAYLSIVGAGKAAFTPNMANAFYAAVASDYNAATTIPVTAWPAALQSQFNTYTAVAVNNNANSNSGNGGYPDFLPGGWLFSFKLTVTQDITPHSGARIWMDSRWFKNPSNLTGAAYFAKCTSPTQLSTSGSSTIYYFIIDLTDADKNLEPLSKITFDSAGGSAVAAVKGDYGSAVPAITAPTKTGYTFEGWSPEIPATFPIVDATYTAKWQINTYNAVFMVDGMIYQTVPTVYGENIVAPSDPVKSGYIFTGWSPSAGTMGAGDMTFNATFKLPCYYIIYMVDGQVWARVPMGPGPGEGGSIYVPMVFPPIGGIQAPVPIPTKTGHTFAGWDPVPPTIMPDHDVIVYAQWMANTYNAIFRVDGVVYEIVPTAYGAQIQLPSNPLKEGFTFMGWTPTVGIMGAADKTFTALFAINIYNAYFKADGDLYATVPTFYGAAITLPATPEKPGYTFAGWETVPAAMPANEVIINAIWNRIPVTLSAKAGSSTTINEANGFITGLAEGMTIETFLSSFVGVSGDGRIEYQYFAASFGTHTRIDLVDNVTGLVVKTYYIVIYGDINGDGSIDSMDAGTAVDFENYMFEWFPPYDGIMLFAGDLNGDGSVDSIDAGKMVDAENYILTINQVTGLAV